MVEEHQKRLCQEHAAAARREISYMDWGISTRINDIGDATYLIGDQKNSLRVFCGIHINGPDNVLTLIVEPTINRKDGKETKYTFNIENNTIGETFDKHVKPIMVKFRKIVFKV
jgi:hypothetical protein